MKGTTSISRKQRSTLSPSFSFPAKSAREDSMHKSIDGCLVNTKVKHVRASTLHHSSKSANSEGKSNEAKTNAEGCNKRSTLISLPGLKRSVVVIFIPYFLSLLYLLCLLHCFSMFIIIFPFYVLVWKVYFSCWIHQELHIWGIDVSLNLCSNDISNKRSIRYPTCSNIFLKYY